MQLLRAFGSVALTMALLAGCSASSKTFYSTPAKVKDTQLCRTFIEAARDGNEQFARDTAAEAVRRGLTLEQCQQKVTTENGILIATGVVATAVGVGLACQDGCSVGGYSAPAALGARYGDYDCLGGPGDGPNYIRGPVRVGAHDPYDLDRDNDGVGCELGDFGA